jgi:methionyl aminopeptidase
MAITLRSRREIELIRRAGVVVSSVLSKLQEIARAGVSTAALDEVARRMTADVNAEALFTGVRNPGARTAFPGAICASVNDEVVHGIPSSKVVLKDSDILSIDFGARLDGYCADAAITVGIGNISAQNRRLIEATRHVLSIATEQMRPGVKWSNIAARMQKYAEGAGFSVVRDFVGHGIGREMHEEPKVPNFVSKDLVRNDILLAEGMVLAVEPMINAGSKNVKTLNNGWTVVTKDGKYSAHFEHTIVITGNGCEVITA